MQQEIDEAVKVLKEGGIVIYPTDTAFGVGCRIDNEDAISRLFKIRQRPKTQATPVLIDTQEMLYNFAQNISQEVQQELIEPYWPGAVTIIFKAKSEKIPELVRGGTDSIGLRIPNHVVPLAIIDKLGVPILGPSANFHNNPTPYKFEDLDPEFKKLVDFVLPGECFICEASTVIDITQKPWKILRQGAIKL